MASLNIILIILLTCHLIIIPDCTGASCRVNGKLLLECGLADWSPWNCSLCATQYQTRREKGVCCPSVAGHSKEACWRYCGLLTKDITETDSCPQQCIGYTDSTTINPITRKTTLPTTTIQITLPTTTKATTQTTTTAATTTLPTTKRTTLPSTIKTTIVPTSASARTTQSASITVSTPPSSLSSRLPLTLFITTTARLSKASTTTKEQDEDRISICIVQCAESDYKDNCIVECMGDKFSKICKILSLSLLFAGLFLGLIIMAVVCRIRRQKEAKYNRVVKPERIVSNPYAKPIMNITYGGENHERKYPLSNFHSGQSSRLPQQSPQHVQSIPTRSPRNANGYNTRNNNNMNEGVWNNEGKYKSQHIPVYGYCHDEKGHFQSRPTVEFQDLPKQPRVEMAEQFDAGSETLSRMYTPLTRISETELC